MNQTPQISDAEWKVMKIIWAHSPITANEVIDQLEDSTPWKPKTVKALIKRLVDKKVLGFHQEGKTYLYFPLVSENDSIDVESDMFLKKVFNGSLNLMLANFIKEQKLTAEEIEELKRIIDSGGGKRRG